jgi:hypothetical protein
VQAINIIKELDLLHIVSESDNDELSNSSSNSSDNENYHKKNNFKESDDKNRLN